MEETEAAWLAGILEGEGCFDWNRVAGRYPRIRIEMRDEDIVRRVAAICGGDAQVRVKRRERTSHNTTYLYQIAARDRVRTILEAILPWMGARRAAKIRQMLESL